MLKKLMVSVLSLAASSGIALAGDAAAGQTVFKKCAPCHDLGETAKNKVGPELNGLDGRHSGQAPGYNYSAANKDSGIIWSEARPSIVLQTSRHAPPTAPARSDRTGRRSPGRSKLRAQARAADRRTDLPTRRRD